MAKIIYTPADMPANAVIAPPVQPGEGALARALLARVRPDVVTAPAGAMPADACHLLTAPDWSLRLRDLRAAGITEDRLLVMPELALGWPDAEWSYAYGAVPLDMVTRRADGSLTMDAYRFHRMLIDLKILHGQFHGQYVCDGYRPGAPADAARIATVLSMLGDEDSRVDFLTILFGDPAQVWASWCRDVYNQLEYMDYATIAPGDTIVNCGVMGGTELPLFLAALDGRGRVVNIDPFGYDHLMDTVRGTLAHQPDMHTEIRAAVHARRDTLRLPIRSGMAVGGMPGATLAGCEHREFPARTVDEIVLSAGLDRVDYLKMDIEGAEIAALKGAGFTLRKFRPQLAISIYHEPSHFWRIPLILRAACPRYRFYVKHYHFHCAETLLYGIPEERPVRARRRGLEMALA